MRRAGKVRLDGVHGFCLFIRRSDLGSKKVQEWKAVGESCGWRCPWEGSRCSGWKQVVCSSLAEISMIKVRTRCQGESCRKMTTKRSGLYQ